MFYKSGRHEFLDEDELKEALEKGKITEEEYKLAYKVANFVINSLDGRIEEFENFTNKYYKLLKERKKMIQNLQNSYDGKTTNGEDYER